MKKVSILLIVFFFSILNVNAKDNVISMNKYLEENFLFIEDSYDKDLTKDGVITGGYYLEEKEEDEEKYNDKQVIIVKYDNKGNLVWKYTYEKLREDNLDFLTYSYDNNGNIDGYLLGVSNEEEIETSLIKLDLEGKVILEKPLTINNEVKVNKIVYDSNNYILIGNNTTNGYLIKLNSNLDIVLDKKSDDLVFYKDLTKITKDNNTIGCALIRTLNDNDELVRLNINLDLEKVIKSLEEYNVSYLTNSNQGFILYGITSEVKLKKGDSSYFIINYNEEDSEVWESIGDISVNKEKLIKLLPITKDNQISKYLLLYSNENSNNLEVVNIKIDGEIGEKIKKVYDKYYLLSDFRLKQNTLYVVGQINCTEEDTCDYNKNSLLLISTEDKVIEVKDNDSKNILIVIGVFILLIVGTVFLKKKKRLKNAK